MNQNSNSNTSDEKRVNDFRKGLDNLDVPKSRNYPTKTVKMGLD